MLPPDDSILRLVRRLANAHQPCIRRCPGESGPQWPCRLRVSTDGVVWHTGPFSPIMAPHPLLDEGGHALQPRRHPHHRSGRACRMRQDIACRSPAPPRWRVTRARQRGARHYGLRFRPARTQISPLAELRRRPPALPGYPHLSAGYARLSGLFRAVDQCPARCRDRRHRHQCTDRHRNDDPAHDGLGGKPQALQNDHRERYRSAKRSTFRGF